MAAKAWILYCESVLMVLAQIMTSVAVMNGMLEPSCSTNAQYKSGMYCGGDACWFCGESVPPVLRTQRPCEKPCINMTRVPMLCTRPELGAKPELANLSVTEFWFPYSESSVRAWCETCRQMGDNTIDTTSSGSTMQANVTAMAMGDWMAMQFCSFVVAFSVVGELKDIELCNLAVVQAGENLSFVWQLLLAILGWARRWIFLTSIVLLIPGLVLLKGGDALNICLNTVAILFLSEIDNLSFAVALGEKVRSRVESAGRVQLGDKEISLLSTSKVLHIGVIVVMVLSGVRAGVDPFVPCVFTFLLGGLLETVMADFAGAAETCKSER